MAQRESEREGVEVDPNHLLLTNGSMQGVTLSAETLQDAHGDRILIEEFSYPGTLSAYRNLKFDMQGIELDENGMRPDRVEEALERGKRDSRLPKGERGSIMVVLVLQAWYILRADVLWTV